MQKFAFSRKKRIYVMTAAVVMVAAGAWIAANPGKRFGLSTRMLTTYNRLPILMADLQVRGDGAMRLVKKSHKVSAVHLGWLTKFPPEVLIIASGWQGDVKAERLDSLAQVQVLTLRTGEALKKFNSLRRQGVRVAIHVHSTC